MIKFICKIGTEKDGVKDCMNVEGWRVEEVRWVEGGHRGDSWWFPGFVGGWNYSFPFNWFCFRVFEEGVVSCFLCVFCFL